MKYWNKDKETRRKHWIRVEVNPRNSVSEMKRWCQLRESNGKFYYYFGVNAWWFEKSEDATIFTLRWS